MWDGGAPWLTFAGAPVAPGEELRRPRLAATAAAATWALVPALALALALALAPLTVPAVTADA
ncbi:hypothetical protein ATJ97_3554 [Georgenia soli]|uniref:Uncharacterized protein n=1 Tax=Georgenia soli TaxID=638953 RepID=A0A2A9ES29_9MICO|nr:hypothetical protein [Georgenia soli]PFG41009.1 hypothetical protein ATJ97_3554 [Georgenia soli]